MNLLKCDKEVARSCPHKKACYGSEEHINDAIYAEGSDCDKYNRRLRHPVAETTGVEPVRRGWWIEKMAYGCRYFECSKCGAHENKHTAIKGRYCWGCGAKMDLEEGQSEP